MERSADVKQELGDGNLRLFLEEIRSGRLKKIKVKIIASKMHPHVHGVFEDKQDKLELVDVVKFMLDKWFLTVIHRPEENGLEKLIKILEHEDVGENALAQKMMRKSNTTSSPTGEEGEQNRLITRSYVNIPVESTDPPSVPSKRRRSWTWKKKVCVLGILFLFVALIVIVVTLAILLLKKTQTTEVLGLVGTSGKSVAWRKSCPGDKYTASLSDLNRSTVNSGMIQVGDEIWVCGGDQDKTRSCEILSLKDGQWRTVDQKMNHPRIRPEMRVEGSKVMVQGGTTSDINSKTGCRNTQEVFDKDDPTLGWVTEDMEETSSCLRSSKLVVWVDKLVWVDCESPN